MDNINLIQAAKSKNDEFYTQLTMPMQATELVNLDVRNAGQVFTPAHIVHHMLSLKVNDGLTLEPSCGNGAFLTNLESKDTVAIEKQANLCKYDHLNIDFFDYNPNAKFQTIIGNPPYVRFKDILDSTRELLNFSLFDNRTNLYLFFIDKCIDLLDDDGELIFITPRDFLKQTSAIKLNEKLFSLGAFTHFNDFGDQILFKGYAPNCAVWRWQKNLKSRKLDDGRYMDCSNGQITFTQSNGEHILSDFFDVKVGAVSGADHIFTQDHDKSIDFVCSTTFKDGSLRKMLYNTYDSSLLQYKDILINRKIKKFDKNNWWEWGRKYCEKVGQRIYVNCKTRQDRPFFISDVPAYDGSMLALFPKLGVRLDSMCDLLNDLDWLNFGFKCGGRYMFSQKSLANLRFDA